MLSSVNILAFERLPEQLLICFQIPEGLCARDVCNSVDHIRRKENTINTLVTYSIDCTYLVYTVEFRQGNVKHLVVLEILLT